MIVASVNWPLINFALLCVCVLLLLLTVRLVWLRNRRMVAFLRKLNEPTEDKND